MSGSEGKEKEQDKVGATPAECQTSIDSGVQHLTGYQQLDGHPPSVATLEAFDSLVSVNDLSCRLPFVKAFCLAFVNNYECAVWLHGFSVR